MKRKMFDFTFCIFCFFCIFFLLQNNQEIANIIIEATSLFLKKILPSLFPMLIINDILISRNIPYYFYLLFNKLFFKIFKTSGMGAYVLIMSLLSGSPSNAYILKNLVEENKLTPEEANHFLMFTYFSNPLFLTMMLLAIFDRQTVSKIILIHYLSNIIIALIKRKSAPKPSFAKLSINNETTNPLIKSINKSISTLLMILGTITFYMLITYIITYFLKEQNLLKTLVAGTLEITNGLNNLTNLNIFLKIKEILAIAIISFGGLSIHTQVKVVLEDSPIHYNSFLKGRIMQSLIGIILVTIF